MEGDGHKPPQLQFSALGQLSYFLNAVALALLSTDSFWHAVAAFGHVGIIYLI